MEPTNHDEAQPNMLVLRLRQGWRCQYNKDEKEAVVIDPLGNRYTYEEGYILYLACRYSDDIAADLEIPSIAELIEQVRTVELDDESSSGTTSAGSRDAVNALLRLRQRDEEEGSTSPEFVRGFRAAVFGQMALNFKDAQENEQELQVEEGEAVSPGKETPTQGPTVQYEYRMLPPSRKRQQPGGRNNPAQQALQAELDKLWADHRAASDDQDEDRAAELLQRIRNVKAGLRPRLDKASVRQRIQLCTKAVQDLDPSGLPVDRNSWRSESPAAAQCRKFKENGCLPTSSSAVKPKQLVAYEASGKLKQQLQRQLVAVMPLVATRSAGLFDDCSIVPTRPTQMAAIQRDASTGCAGSDCVCMIIPTAYPFHYRCLLRFIVHEVFMKDARAQHAHHMLQCAKTGAQSLLASLMQARKTSTSAQCVWAWRFIFGLVPYYFTQGTNAAQSKQNITNDIQAFNKEIRGVLKSKYNLPNEDLSMFEAVIVDNLHVIPLRREEAGAELGLAYDPFFFQQVVVRCAHSANLVKILDLEADLCKQAYSPLLRCPASGESFICRTERALEQSGSPSEPAVLAPIAMFIDEWDKWRQDCSGQIGALDLLFFRGRDKRMPLLRECAVAAGCTATPHVLFICQSRSERPLRMVYKKPSDDYISLPGIEHLELISSGCGYITLDCADQYQPKVRGNSGASEMAKHPAIKACFDNALDAWRELTGDEKQPDDHVHAMIRHSPPHAARIKLAKEAIDLANKENIPLITIIDDNGRRQPKQNTAIKIFFSKDAANAAEHLVLPNGFRDLAEAGRLPTTWKGVYEYMAPKTRAWLCDNASAIREKQLRSLSKSRTYGIKVPFPGKPMVDFRPMVLEILWQLQKLLDWPKHPLFCTLAGSKASRANVYKTISHQCAITHCHIRITEHSEAACIESVLQTFGRECSTGPKPKRKPVLYVDSSTSRLLQAAIVGWCWGMLKALHNQPIHNDIFDNEIVKGMGNIIGKRDKAMKFSRRRVNPLHAEGVFPMARNVMVRNFSNNSNACSIDMEQDVLVVDTNDPAHDMKQLIETSIRDLAKQTACKRGEIHEVEHLFKRTNRLVVVSKRDMAEGVWDLVVQLQRLGFRNDDYLLKQVNTDLINGLLEGDDLNPAENDWLSSKRTINWLSTQGDLMRGHSAPAAFIAHWNQLQVSAKMYSEQQFIIFIVPNVSFLKDNKTIIDMKRGLYYECWFKFHEGLVLAVKRGCESDDETAPDQKLHNTHMKQAKRSDEPEPAKDRAQPKRRRSEQDVPVDKNLDEEWVAELESIRHMDPNTKAQDIQRTIMQVVEKIQLHMQNGEGSSAVDYGRILERLKKAISNFSVKGQAMHDEVLRTLDELDDNLVP